MWSVVSLPVPIPARARANRPAWPWALLIALGCLSPLAAQEEPRRVRIAEVTFTGVAVVDVRQLASALTTRASSRWPLGRRAYVFAR